MRAIPYLSFSGTCREAFEFYAELLGGELDLITHGDSPIADEVSPEWHDRVLNAYIKAGDLELMASDMPPEQKQQMAGFCVSIQLQDVAEAERIFTALQDGGSIQMPFEQTFWAERFGMCTDRFGTPWMINCDSSA